MIPHFEKMLYDNGPLLALYADAWQVTRRRPVRADRREETAAWVMREMQSPEGGYYCLAGRRLGGRGRQVLRVDAARKCVRCWTRRNTR